MRQSISEEKPISMPASFQTATAAQLIPPPAPVLFTASGDPYFASNQIQFYNVPESVSAAQCYYSTPPKAATRKRPFAGIR